LAAEKDISSTEKLLNIIRSKDSGPVNPVADTPPPGLWQRIRTKLQSSGAKDVTGVEFFRDTINMVRMGRDKSGWHPVQAMQTAFPEDMDLEHPQLPSFLKTQLQRIDPGKESRLWIGLPPSRGESWNVEVPRVKRSLTNAVYWSARKERTFDENEYFFDYRIRDQAAGHQTQKLAAEVCIASVRDIRMYQKIFSKAGYPPAGITLPAFSIQNLLARNWLNPGEEAYAVLYIGEDSSYIETHGRHIPLFKRVIKTGRDSILDALAASAASQGPAEAEAEPATATERKKAAQFLHQPARSTDADLLEKIQPALERIARQLERTIDHSVNVQGNPAPECIYICGAIARLPGLAEFFNEQLAIRAVIMDIPDHAAAAGPEPIFSDPEVRTSLVSTMGMAMPGPDTINFLHTAMDMDREKRAMRSTNAVAAGCALLFVATAAWWWSTIDKLEQARDKTAAIEQKLEAFSPRLSAADLIELTEEIQGKKDELRQYSRKLYPVAVFREISRMTPEGIKLLSVRLGGFSPQGSGGGDSGGPDLIIDGFVPNDPAMNETRLTGYLLTLRRSAVFNDPVVTKSGSETLASGENVYRFTLNMKISGL